MLLYFLSDKGTICGEAKFERDETLIPHPYDCTMFIGCTKAHTFSTEGYVDKHEDGQHVFNPVTRLSAWKSEITCAKQERKAT